MSHELKKFGPYDHRQVMNFLPHRFPFLFVDKIEEMFVPIDEKGIFHQVGTTITGIKNATINEPYFAGHFPGMPITPGVIMIETMAQVASFAVLPWVKMDNDMRILSKFALRLAGVDATRFRRPVVPGDSVRVKTTVIKHKGPIWVFECTATVDGQLAVESEILASVDVGDSA